MAFQAVGRKFKKEIMSELSWGVKRTCNGCGSRFYDLRKLPANCPKCGVVFELLTTVRGKRGRAAAKEVVLPLDDLDLALGDDAVVVDDPTLLEEEDDQGFSDIAPDLDSEAH